MPGDFTYGPARRGLGADDEAPLARHDTRQGGVCELMVRPSSEIVRQLPSEREVCNASRSSARSQGSTGFGRSMIYPLEAARRLPCRLWIGARAVGWVESEVQGWLMARIQHYRADPGPCLSRRTLPPPASEQPRSPVRRRRPQHLDELGNYLHRTFVALFEFNG